MHLASGAPLRAGTGVEPMGPPGPVPSPAETHYPMGAVGESPDPWERLRERIMGGGGMSAAQRVAEYELRRRAFNPDIIIPRPLIVSQVVFLAPNGLTQLLWTFATVGVVTGISAQIYNENAGDNIGNYFLTVRAGSDGGYIIGTDNNRASLAGLQNIPAVESGVHRSLQPVASHPNNQWTGTLEGIGLAGDPLPNVHITFYGCNLWSPAGQIL